jgi:hypothetical protein
MDRIALAKRLESLSSVFASHTPYSRDLKAMAYVLNKVSDDKFSSILSKDFLSDTVAADSAEACGPGPMGGPSGIPGTGEGDAKVIVIKKPPMIEEETQIMSAEATEKTAGMFWSKEASKAVIDNLLRDVVGMNKSVCCDTGRHLETEQIPDGTHKGIPEKPAPLKEEQTPNIAPVLESNMVEKSHGKVQKEASLDDIKKKKEENEKKKDKKDLEALKKAQKKSEKKEAAVEPVVEPEEKKEAAVEPAVESEEKREAAVEKKEEESCDKESSSSIIEGIELVASMDDVELDPKEAAELSKLFV